MSTINDLSGERASGPATSHTTDSSVQKDIALMQGWLDNKLDRRTVAQFVPGPGIAKLTLTFDPSRLQAALSECLRRQNYQGSMQTQGFSALALTRRPGQTEMSENDLSGRYWLRDKDSYEEEAREELVDEAAFSEFNPEFGDTYFAFVHSELSKRFRIGRMRVLSKPVYNCNSWHRDPEPRIHIPITSNPGSLFIVNHHVTHLPADGSVYFTDTRGYHTAINGGEADRVHIVAALPDGLVTE